MEVGESAAAGQAQNDNILYIGIDLGTSQSSIVTNTGVKNRVSSASRRKRIPILK